MNVAQEIIPRSCGAGSRSNDSPTSKLRAHIMHLLPQQTPLWKGIGT